MTEAELLDRVLKQCGSLGLGVYHNPETKRATMRGFPDLVVWGRGGLIFRELKSERGRRSIAQYNVATSLRAAGADFAVWRPIDWADGTIWSALDDLAGER